MPSSNGCSFLSTSPGQNIMRIIIDVANPNRHTEEIRDCGHFLIHFDEWVQKMAHLAFDV